MMGSTLATVLARAVGRTREFVCVGIDRLGGARANDYVTKAAEGTAPASGTGGCQVPSGAKLRPSRAAALPRSDCLSNQGLVSFESRAGFFSAAERTVPSAAWLPCWCDWDFLHQ
ncbi:hypothetical protein VTN49DRAFT_3713 [Thermomyces lanuginosus]|uniref:uncharacterized protein n=1 Tax=Thermomyces lanuginosus TaxID=5541 RepID=UPI0037446C1C